MMCGSFSGIYFNFIFYWDNTFFLSLCYFPVFFFVDLHPCTWFVFFTSSYLSTLCLGVGVTVVFIYVGLPTLGILVDFDLNIFQGLLRNIGVGSRFSARENLGVALRGFMTMTTQ